MGLKMSVIEMIHHIGKLDYDTLRDVRDLLDYEAYNDQIADTNDKKLAKRLEGERNKIKLRIRGRHSTRNKGMRYTWDDIDYPDDLQPLASMSAIDRAVVLATVKQLISAKRPKAGQRSNDSGRVARGSFQKKVKKNAFIVRDEDGNPALDEDGNMIFKDAYYLYFRIYTHNHDGTKRNASIYIGSLNRNDLKPFCQAVQDARYAEDNNEPIQDYMITRDELIDIFVNGYKDKVGYDAVKAKRQDMDGDD